MKINVLKTQGFTLIEVLIALFILSISLLGIFKLGVSLSHMNSSTKIKLLLSQTVQNKMEQLKKVGIKNLASGSFNYLEPITKINLYWEIKKNNPTKNTSRINIRAEKKGKKVEYETIMGR